MTLTAALLRKSGSPEGHARIVAAHRGLSLSGLVAQQLTQLAEADERYELARAVALDALAGATGGGAPNWHREELYDR